MSPKLGVQMFTLRAYTQDVENLDKCLKKVSEIGYRSIQVSAFGAIEPQAIADLCQQYGLDIGGTHVSWDRFQNDLDSVIAEHKLWQCRHTAVGMIPPADYLSMDGLSRFYEELKPIAETLNAAGMTFSYHNHAHEFLQFSGKTWLKHMLEMIPGSCLKMELDTHWVVAGGGDPVVWVNVTGDRMPLLHLKDFKLNSDFRRQFAPVGDGNMNWDAILNAAASHPIEYYFVEQDNCYGEDEFECLKRSYDFLHTNYGLN
jgi:sugar phosphate isomerase/epimerase